MCWCHSDAGPNCMGLSIYIIQIGTGEGGTGMHVPFWTTPNAHNSHVVRNTHCKLQLHAVISNKQCLKLGWQIYHLVRQWKRSRLLIFSSIRIDASHSPSTSNQAIGSNRTNVNNDSTSEILPAEAAAIDVKTEPTSEQHNAALKLLWSLPFQPKDVVKIHHTQCQQSQKVVCFAKQSRLCTQKIEQ